ncbi:MAG: hypothetical protein DUD27_06045 [Lachnospiraceae bacterium]|uniref:DUF4352 domain-containing protein n=1 Tax=Candidatus Weimeria bifida TaxID=2599074 RepID=A0A6N7IXV8_9FIRM|nr:DUF4352 domain-containing protein [Candidatus Weimeria bifida]RRF96087.1 MAG: hypothetical protein DUD27_06045 [Lachnospiraceae bacterium]
MRKGFLLTAGILGMSVMLSGCGLQSNELKGDEQDQIAAYCAQVVSKYDKSTKTGLTPVASSKDSTSTSKQQSSDTSKKSTQASGNSSSAKNSTTDSEKTPITKTFTEAIGIKGLSLLYRDAKVGGGYSQSDVYDLSPDKGNELLVVRLKMINNTSKNLKVDISSANLKFKAAYGNQTSDADMTLLLNDLTTYQGTIAAGKGRNMVMLFQFPKGTVKDTSKVSYTVQKDNSSFKINTDMSKKR